MSAGPIPFLTPADLSFTPGTPDFTDFVASQLGNLGTDSDGFDTLLSDTIALEGEAETLLASFDPDLIDVGTTLAGLAGLDPASDQASLTSVSDAIDAALNDYNGQLPPQPNAGTPTQTPPPPPTPHKKITLPGMRVGDTETNVEVGGASWTSLEIEPQVFDLTDHDPDIFHWRQNHTEQPTGHGDKILTDTWYLLVNPTKAGTFTATVEETDQTSSPQVTTDTDYTVTITA